MSKLDVIGTTECRHPYPEDFGASDALRSILYESLSDLAAAREYEASYPSSAIPLDRELCETCGGDNRAHRCWVSIDARCTSDWHSSQAKEN